MLQKSMTQDRIAPRRWTRQEFEQLGSLGFFEPEERLELLDGEIFRMTPQSSWHATAITKTNGEDYQFHLILAPPETIAPLTHPKRIVTVRDLLP